MHAAAQPSADRQTDGSRLAGLRASDPGRSLHRRHGSPAGPELQSASGRIERRGRLCLAPLRLDALAGLSIESADLFRRIERGDKQRQVMESIRDSFPQAAILTRHLMESGRFTPVDIEQRLEKCVGSGLAVYMTSIIEEVGASVDAQLRKLGLPEPRHDESHCSVNFDRGEFRFDLHWCQYAEVESLVHCSDQTRRQFQRELANARLPIMWIDEFYPYAFGGMEFLPSKYPASGKLPKSFVDHAWSEALKESDVEAFEAEDGSVEPGLYGIGGRADFEEILRRHSGAIRERKRRGRFVSHIDREWKRRIGVLRALVRCQPKSDTYGRVDRDDSRAVEEGFALISGQAGRSVGEHYFELTNDNTGEVPGGIFLLDEKDGLYEGLFWLKAVEGVMAMFNEEISR